jgi:hypothetical protein
VDDNNRQGHAMLKGDDDSDSLWPFPFPYSRCGNHSPRSLHWRREASTRMGSLADKKEAILVRPHAQCQVRACMQYMHPRADSGPATWAGTMTMRDMDHRIRNRDRKCSSHLPLLLEHDPGLWSPRRPQHGGGGDVMRRSIVRSQKTEQRRWKLPQCRQPQSPPCLPQCNGVTKQRRHHQLC